MEEFVELVKESLKQKMDIEKLGNISTKITSINYFVLLENGIIKESNSEEILEELGIEFLFVFPKIYYSPLENYYYSWMSPIIVNRKERKVVDKLSFNDWTFVFYGQETYRRPNPIKVGVYNQKLKFIENWEISNSDFNNGIIETIKFIFTVYKYNSKTEADYLKLIHKKDQIIAELKSKVNLS